MSSVLIWRKLYLALLKIGEWRRVGGRRGKRKSEGGGRMDQAL